MPTYTNINKHRFPQEIKVMFIYIYFIIFSPKRLNESIVCAVTSKNMKMIYSVWFYIKKVVHRSLTDLKLDVHFSQKGICNMFY